MTKHDDTTSRGDGTTFLVAHTNPDSGVLLLVGAAVSPAGVSTADCGNGVTVGFDGVVTGLVIEISVLDPEDLLALRTLEVLLGADAIDALTETAPGQRVPIAVARSEALSAAADLAEFERQADLFRSAAMLDPDAELIERVVRRARLCDAGLPVDAEIEAFELRDLIAALHRTLSATSLASPIVSEGVDVVRAFVGAEAADVRTLESLLDAAQPTAEAGWPGPVDLVEDALADRLVFASDEVDHGDGAADLFRRDTVEWHLRPGIGVPEGFDETEDAITTTVEGTYVRVTVGLKSGAALPDGATAWAVVFDATTGDVVAFAPGRAEQDPLGRLAEMAGKWTSVMTLPDGIGPTDVYVGIRTDPRQSGEPPLVRDFGRATRLVSIARGLSPATTDKAIQKATLFKHATEDFLKISDSAKADGSTSLSERALECARSSAADLATIISDLEATVSTRDLRLDTHIAQRLADD